MGFKCSVSALVAVIIALTTFLSFSHANPHIEDELVEIKDELGEVFSSSIPDDYYQRMDLKDCHTRFHARPVNEYRMAMFEGVSLNGTEFPHLAVVGQRGPAGDVQWKCTGSLISKRFVLTAASCVSDRNVGLLVVKMGDVNSAIKSDDKFAQELGASNVTVHPSYNTRYQYNDLALVELDKDVVLSAGVCPACIWSSAHYPFNWYEVAGVDMTAAAASKSDSIKVKPQTNRRDTRVRNHRP